MEDFKIFILIDRPNKTFFPGQVISGNIGFILNEAYRQCMPRDFSAILVQYIGTAAVAWEEKYDNYSDQEEYFNFTQPVFGQDGNRALIPGTHRFPFQYQIPFTAPSTFTGSKGKVWYRLLAHVEVPGKKTRTVEQVFTVVATTDLNDDIEILRPISMEFEEVVSCCCFGSAPVSVRVCLPSSGYCPGQTMPVQVAVKNNSNVEVSHMLFTLFSEESYRVRNPESECTEPAQILAEVKKGPVLTKTQKEFTVDLVVPDMIVPNIDNCQLIDIHYYFKVFIKLTGCSNENSDVTEVALGYVPLASTKSTYVRPLREKLPIGLIPAPPKGPISSQAPVNYVPMTPQAPPYPVTQAPHPVTQAPYPVTQAPPQPYGSKQKVFIQNNDYYDAAEPQINWQWDGGISQSTGYSYTAVPQDEYTEQYSAMNDVGSESNGAYNFTYPDIPLQNTNYAKVPSVTNEIRVSSDNTYVPNDNKTVHSSHNVMDNEEWNERGHVSNNTDNTCDDSTRVTASSTNCYSDTSTYKCRNDSGGDTSGGGGDSGGGDCGGGDSGGGDCGGGDSGGGDCGGGDSGGGDCGGYD